MDYLPDFIAFYLLYAVPPAAERFWEKKLFLLRKKLEKQTVDFFFSLKILRCQLKVLGGF